MKNECLDAATAVLDEAGIPYTVGMGGKHHRIDFEVNGQRCRATTSVSPSDRRAPTKAACEMRRKLRDAGFEFAQKQEADMPQAGVSHVSDALTMSSREIADRTGKEHKNVLADIRKMLADLRLGSADFSADVPDSYGRPQPGYLLPKRECLILVSGYSITLRASIIDRWQELEDAARPDQAALLAPEVLQALVRIEHALAVANREVVDARAAADLAMEATAEMKARLSEAKVAPTLDLIGTMTSDELIGRAGIKAGQRVRGTSAMVTARLLRFTAGHGCFRTPAALNPSMPWRFSRDRALEWLFGASLGAEQIRSQVERQTNKRRARPQPARQGNLTLVVPA